MILPVGGPSAEDGTVNLERRVCPTPVGGEWNIQEIESRARNLREESGYQVGAGLDKLRSIVAELGGKFEPKTPGQGFSLRVRATGDFTIYIPPYTPVNCERYLIAHELGHYLLHYKDLGCSGEMLADVDGPLPDAEREAEAFAYAFLLPDNDSLIERTEQSADIFALARIFGVPMRAIKKRLSEPRFAERRSRADYR